MDRSSRQNATQAVFAVTRHRPRLLGRIRTSLRPEEAEDEGAKRESFSRGTEGHCSMARVPTIAEEDAKRANRERECLVGERTRIVPVVFSVLCVCVPSIGEYNFAGQYQQSPAALSGGMVKVAWFKRYRENERPECFDRIVQSWDTANKATELSDFSVCTTWGVSGKNLFLLGLLRRRLEYPALKRAVREQQSLFDATVVAICAYRRMILSMVGW
jgi:hypothetical protein